MAERDADSPFAQMYIHTRKCNQFGINDDVVCLFCPDHIACSFYFSRRLSNWLRIAAQHVPRRVRSCHASPSAGLPLDATHTSIAAVYPFLGEEVHSCRSSALRHTTFRSQLTKNISHPMAFKHVEMVCSCKYGRVLFRSSRSRLLSHCGFYTVVWVYRSR